MSSNRSVGSNRSMNDMRQGNRGSNYNAPASPVRPLRYHQPTLATIQSPRNMIPASPLGLPRPASLKSLDQLTVVVPRSAIQGDMRRAMSAKALNSNDSRPSGWLGEDICNRSFNDLSAAAASSRRKREPTEHVRTLPLSAVDHDTWDQVPPADETEMLRMKRDKARESERRLRNEMQRSRSNKSMNSSGSSFEPLY